MYGAEGVKRDIWLNVKLASGDEITINRRYLAYLLSRMEKSVYGQAYSQGYQNGIAVKNKNLPIDKNFKDRNEEW